MVTIPMTQTPVLIEPSLADAIAIIATSVELPEQTRRHWATSLRQIAKAFDKPLELIPARYSAICGDLLRLHEVPVGLTAKTLRKSQEQREKRPALADAGEGCSEIWGASDACLGGAAG